MHVIRTINTYSGHYLLRSPKVCIFNKLFPANWLSACHDDNLIKLEVMYSEWREELSCPSRDVDHWMASDVNKWRDLT